MQFIDRYTILGHFNTAGPKSHVAVPHVSMMTLLYVWLLFSFKKQTKTKQQQKNAVQDTITVTPVINTVLWVPYLVYTVYICF